MEPISSRTLEQVEREHILRELRETGGVVSASAARLGMPRTTLNAMMRKLGISRKDFDLKSAGYRIAVTIPSH